MRSITLKVLFSMGALLLPLATTTAEETSVTTQKPNNQVIVIQDPVGSGPKGLKRRSDAAVESGSDQIVGTPGTNIRSARRAWEQACKSWKHEMKQLNRQNLIQASCGSPNLKPEMHQSEKFYTYESTGKFKVRVSAKD